MNVRAWDALTMAMFPIAMVGLNLASVFAGLLEGRLKAGAMVFALLYVGTILPACRGDLAPFAAVACRPPM